MTEATVLQEFICIATKGTEEALLIVEVPGRERRQNGIDRTYICGGVKEAQLFQT